MTDALRDLASGVEWEQVLGAQRAIVFKHSTQCWVSALAFGAVRKFVDRRHGIPVYVVDVLGERTLSKRIAAETGVPHESPQVIVLERGRPVWDSSHTAITVAALERHALANAGGKSAR